MKPDGVVKIHDGCIFMKSVRGLGTLVIVVMVGSGVTALLGFIGLAICLAAVGIILVLGVVQATERRRHAAHRQVVHDLAAIRSRDEINMDTLLRLQRQHSDSLALAVQDIKEFQKQHSRSLGLTFREINAFRKQYSDSFAVAVHDSEERLKQHSISLGLTLREIKSLSAEFTGSDPLLEVYAERQLATYLNALRITKRELLEATVVAPIESKTKKG